MVAEGEKFAEEDALHKKRSEAMNSLSSFVSSVKSQMADKAGLGGKLSEQDKLTLKETLSEVGDWIDEHGAEASLEDLEEKLAGKYTEDIVGCIELTISTEVQGQVSPITSKIYESSKGEDHHDRTGRGEDEL